VRERLFPAAALVVAVVTSAVATGRLARLGMMPEHAAPYVLVFALAFGVAVVAGKCAAPGTPAEPPHPGDDTAATPCGWWRSYSVSPRSRQRGCGKPGPLRRAS
jgi:hypothetical protein